MSREDQRLGAKVPTRSFSGYPLQLSTLPLPSSQSPAPPPPPNPPPALPLVLPSHVTLPLSGSCPDDGCSRSAVPVGGQGLRSS